MRFLDILSSLDIDYRETTRGEVRICCLQCDDDKFHLYVNPGKGVFHCFKCGWSGGIRKLFAELRQIYHTMLEFPEREEEVEEYAEKSATIGRTIACSLPPGYFPLTEEGPNRELALRYLEKRGIDLATIRRYEIGYCNMGSFGGRIIFPIHYRGKVVSYLGRDIFGRVPKVLTPMISEADPPSRYLYLFDQAIFFPRLVLTEGVFDCLTLQVLDPHTCAVATFGKNLTTAQVDLILSERFSEVIFAWDGDALKEAVRWGKILAPLVPVKIAILPVGEDPNSLGKEKTKEYIENAVDLLDAEVSMLIEEVLLL